MKKVFVMAAMVVAMLGLCSCEKDEPACWEISITETLNFMGQKESFTTTTVMYGTEEEVNAFVKQTTGSSMNGSMGMSVTFDVEKTKLEDSECF